MAPGGPGAGGEGEEGELSLDPGGRRPRGSRDGAGAWGPQLGARLGRASPKPLRAGRQGARGPA